ncbi:MAG: hypothetical protein EXS32_16005 [Opitutus sp.]|nr:hypothetical protein [Opitutus sp.]
MPELPPLLPDETLRRVLRLARLDGLSVLAVAGLFAVLTALAGDVVGAVIGLLVAGAGAIELHGASLLREGEPRGMNWLVGSQLFLLVTVLGYCALRLLHPELGPLRAAVTEEMKTSLELADYTPDEFIRMVYNLTYAIFALVTFFYQGGMAIYYHRRRDPVAQALADEV